MDPGPYIANFTLWFYEFNFISSLYKKDYRRALALRNTFRLINDISTLNEADILDLNISLKDGKFICSVYDKRDEFKFSVVRLTPRFSNQSDNVGYCTFASQVIRFTRICNNIDRILFLFNLFVSLGCDPCKLIKTFTNCINRHKFSEKFKTIGHILSPISI